MQKLMKELSIFHQLKIKWIISLVILLLSGVATLEAQTDTSYVLQRGDVLEINVMEHPEFSISGLIVMPDGFVQFPGLGSIPAAGMNIKEFTKLMHSNVEKYVVNPILTVFLRTMPNQVANVVGYVNRPGQIPVFEPTDLITALSKAGGIKDVRKCKWITIVRSDQSFEKIRASKLFSSKQNGKPIMLYVGDTVYVMEPSGSINWSFLSFLVQLGYISMQLVSFLN